VRYLKPLLCILSAALLAGCNNVMGRPDNSLDAGYQVILHKPLTIVPEVARVFLQAGEAFPQYGLNEYEPHCSFEVRKVLPEQPQTIEPDTFKVTRVQRLREEVVWLRPVQFASLQLADAAVDSGLSDIFEGYHFWLYSETQPDVLRMTCRYILTEPWNSRTPTLDEMRFSLGGYATLNTGDGSLRPGQF
jgi:hypothetical protein